MIRWLLVLSGVLTALPTLQAQQAAQDRPSLGLVLWLQAQEGVNQGISGLVSRWEDQSIRDRDLVQGAGEFMPRASEFALSGGPGLVFDGDDCLARTRGMPGGSYTKVVVVQLWASSPEQHLLSGASDHALLFDASQRLTARHGITEVVSPEPVNLGEVTIVAVTFDQASGSTLLYQDGLLVAAGTLPQHSDATIHAGSSVPGESLQGVLGEVLLYNRAMPPQEILQLSFILAGDYLHRPKTTSVTFDTIPRPAQLFQRDANDRATVQVSGTARLPTFESVHVEVSSGGLVVDQDSQLLTYLADEAPFALEVEIAAGLINYDLQVSLVRGEITVPVAERKNLVCGDAYLIQGQSNALAWDVFSENLANQHQSQWIRSFGILQEVINSDLHWDLAEGEGFATHAAVGAWGLVMGAQLVAQQQIPVALLTTGLGGSSIVQHLRDDADPDDPTTVYGNQLLRAQEAGIADDVRAILWFQGEADYTDVMGNTYLSRFSSLHDDWHTDYPSLQKIYVLQIRKGCNQPTGERILVREVQRRLPESFADVEVMSTTAVPGHDLDGCHYSFAGYQEIGIRLARLLARDFHGSSDVVEITPPRIQSAVLAGANDQIVLSFEPVTDSLVLRPGAEVLFSVSDPGAVVISGTVLANTLTLQLSAPIIPASLISHEGHDLDFPWLVNGRDVGALTFLGFPIQ